MAASSGITGLIFPGMMDEPGCNAGKFTSASPVFGPEEIKRISLEMRMISNDRFRSADDTAAMARFDCMA